MLLSGPSEPTLLSLRVIASWTHFGQHGRCLLSKEVDGHVLRAHHPSRHRGTSSASWPTPGGQFVVGTTQGRALQPHAVNTGRCSEDQQTRLTSRHPGTLALQPCGSAALLRQICQISWNGGGCAVGKTLETLPQTLKRSNHMPTITPGRRRQPFFFGPLLLHSWHMCNRPVTYGV